LLDRVMRWLPALVVTLAVAACFPVDGAAPAIPAIPAERLPPPPASTVTLIWQPGHYDWDGTNYVYIKGRWVSRGGHGPLWQDGMWHRAGSRWEWVPAHWL